MPPKPQVANISVLFIYHSIPKDETVKPGIDIITTWPQIAGMNLAFSSSSIVYTASILIKPVCHADPRFNNFPKSGKSLGALNRASTCQSSLSRMEVQCEEY
jgi:hypothetical protein